MSLQTKIKVISVYSLCSNSTLGAMCNVGKLLHIPYKAYLLMDVATTTPLPGEHGDSATDLPSKRLTEVNILGPMNVVGSATLCSSFCGGIYSSSLHTMAVKASSC